MNVKELKKVLQKYPDDMEIWFSPDIGIGEGGVKLDSVEKKLASEAGLDGDDISDEYIYIDDKSKKEIRSLQERGYKSPKGRPGKFPVLSKEILILHDSNSNSE